MGSSTGAREHQVRVAGHLHSQERDTSSKVNVYDESLLMDNPEYRFFEPMLKKRRVRGKSLPLLNLRYLDWTTVFTPTTCILWFERFGCSVLDQFDGSAEKGPLEQLQWATSIREGCPHPTVASNALFSRTSMIRGLPPQVGSAAVGSLRDGVRTATEEGILLSGSGVASMARQWKRTRSWSTLVSCVRTPVAGVSSVGDDSSATPRQACYRLAESAASYSPSRDRTSSARKHGSPSARSILAAALWPSVPVIIERTNF